MAPKYLVPYFIIFEMNKTLVTCALLAVLIACAEVENDKKQVLEQ